MMKKEENEKKVNKTSPSKKVTPSSSKTSVAKKKTPKKEENTNRVSSSHKRANLAEVEKKILVSEEGLEDNLSKDDDLEDFGEEVVEQNREEKKRKIKMPDLLLIGGLFIAILFGCLFMNGGKDEVSYQLPLTLTGDAGLQLLSYRDYQTKIDNNESFVVVLSRESCSHCANFLPVAKQFASDNQLPMYYVDTDTFTEDEWSTFEESNTFLKKNSSNWGTPTTIVLAGRDAVDYIEGETTADKLQELYDKYFDLKQE